MHEAYSLKPEIAIGIAGPIPVLNLRFLRRLWGAVGMIRRYLGVETPSYVALSPPGMAENCQTPMAQK